MSGHIEGFDGDERGRTFTSVHAVERPPTLDYYRNSVRKTDLAKARASLADLTRGRTQTALHETFETYEKRNLQIVESQLKKKPVPETRSESSISSPPTPPEDPEVSGKKGKKDEGKRKKLGVFEGVFLRVVSNLFGVMLYLRISWVAGQAGIFGGAGVVALGSLVAIVTTLSTSAICTNGQVKGGGSYYLISRSLGPEFGGAIGIIFSIANAVGAAMYVVGFAETVQTLLRNYDVQIVDGGLNDIRIMGLAACVPLICVVFLGTNFESKMQMVLVALFLSSIVDYWVGTFLWGLILPVDSEKAMRGITGYSGTTFNDNLYPNFRDGYNFFTVFAVYFPATTDIMAGANVSGDLQDPQRAIPLGTLSAIVFCSIVYLIMILMTGGTVLRDADGFSMPELHNATLRNQLSPACADNSTCPYGLMNYFQIVELGSGWGPLVTAGIFACTLSSALVSMVSAPKIFQAVCRDKLFPYIDYFATGYGKNDEPRKGYFLTLAIVCAVILIGDLNAIAPVISNFFLCGYALTNFACFDNSFADSPGFRPSFKYYNKWVALCGSLLCIAIMFIVSWVTALITIVFFGALFLFILHRKPEANWGTSLQAHHYNSAISSVIGLERTDEHVKNYHPQVIVLTGNPVARSSLVDFVYSITKGQSLMVCGNVVKYSATKSVVEMMKRLEEDVRQWFKERHTRVFYNAQANPDFRKGAQSLFLGSASGLGKLRPNILVLGFKNDWIEVAEKNLPEVNEYFGVIRDAFDNNMAVAILRNGNRGLDFSELLYQHNDDTFVKCNYKKRDSTFSLKRASIFGKGSPPKIGDSSLAGYNVVNMDQRGYSSDETIAVTGFKRRSDSSLASIATVDGTLEGRYHKSYANLTAQQRILLGDMNRFHTRVKKATIDVWWLYDDGGLTLLVSYLLAQPRSYLENASMRIFALSSKSESELEEEKTNIETLLTKFRIKFSQLTIVPHDSKKPPPEMIGEFEKLVSPFRYDPTEGSHEGMISESELQSHREQTWHHLRIADLLRRHSSDSNLIVLTLPVPRKGFVSSTLYLSWLEMLSRDLPPVFFVRGNQENVLTFYL